jgi:hypothetical protein
MQKNALNLMQLLCCDSSNKYVNDKRAEWGGAESVSGEESAEYEEEREHKSSEQIFMVVEI